MSTLTNRDPELRTSPIACSRRLANVRAIAWLPHAPLIETVHWTSFSRHHPRSSHPRILCIYHGPLAVKFSTRPLSPLHTRASGMELNSYSSFCLLHRTFIYRPPTRLTAVVEWLPSFSIPPWTTHCPARSVSSPAHRAGLNCHLTSVSALQLRFKDGVSHL